MADPNEPRRMSPRGNGARKPDFNNVSGDAAHDGFTRFARRNPPNSAPEVGPFGLPFGGTASDAITPSVGQRDYDRGPRFSEDY